MATKREQEFLAEHLRYEIGMLRYAHALINISPSGPDWNAYFECFATHARNLVQFLSDKRALNSFKGSDFASGYRQPKKDRIKGILQDMVEQVFHPTKNRKVRAAEKVNLGRCNVLATWVENALAEFNVKVDEKFLPYWNGVPSVPSIPTGRAETACTEISSSGGRRS